MFYLWFGSVCYLNVVHWQDFRDWHPHGYILARKTLCQGSQWPKDLCPGPRSPYWGGSVDPRGPEKTEVRFSARSATTTQRDERTEISSLIFSFTKALQDIGLRGLFPLSFYDHTFRGERGVWWARDEVSALGHWPSQGWYLQDHFFKKRSLRLYTSWGMFLSSSLFLFIKLPQFGDVGASSVAGPRRWRSRRPWDSSPWWIGPSWADSAPRSPVPWQQGA